MSWPILFLYDRASVLLVWVITQVLNGGKGGKIIILSLYSNQQIPIMCQTFSMIGHIDEKRLHDQVNKRKDKHKDKDARSREARELS